MICVWSESLCKLPIKCIICLLMPICILGEILGRLKVATESFSTLTYESTLKELSILSIRASFYDMSQGEFINGLKKVIKFFKVFL